MSGTDTIDITDLVESMKASWIVFHEKLIFNAIASISGVGFVTSPIVRVLLGKFLNWILTIIADSTLMSAFFLNTAIRKAAQAKDYVEAVRFKNSLPPNTSTKDYHDAEKKQMEAFLNFVFLGN